MNIEVMNYAYLSGFLESELRALAYDDKFFRIKDTNDRIDYLKKLISNAHAKTVDFEKQVKGA
jgi:hypothetical protein